MLKLRHVRHPLQTVRTAAWLFRSLWFDLRYGTKTANYDSLDSVEIDGPNRGSALGYDPTDPFILLSALRSLTIDHRNYVFVDIGSGKGRTLIAAARYPFKRIIGVEFARQLHESALSNLKKWSKQRCFHVQSVWMDAIRYQLPAQPTVLYLFNPFKAPVFEEVMRNLEASFAASPRSIFIVYVNPRLHHLVMKLRGIRVLQESKHYKIYQLGSQ